MIDWFDDDQYCRAGGSESPACDELCFEGCCVPGIDFTDYETVPTSDGTPLETMDNGLDPFYENFADSLLERLNLELYHLSAGSQVELMKNEIF